MPFLCERELPYGTKRWKLLLRGGEAAADPEGDGFGVGQGVDVVEGWTPAEGAGEDVEPPLGGAVAGGVGVKGDQDDGGDGQLGDPGAAAAAGGGTGGYSGPDYKNVPTVLDVVLDPLVKLVPRDVRRVLQALPKDVARTTPYYIAGMLGMVAALVIFQAVREINATRTLIALLKRDKNIADQKDNFIALASHYLRTPLTLMRNGLDTIVALKELPLEQIDPLRKTVATLDTNIKSILADVENNDELKGIRNPDIRTSQPNVLRSRFFW